MSSASARRPSSGISAATRSKPIATSSAATAKPKRWSIRSIRFASICLGKPNGSDASMAIYRPRCCCRARPVIYSGVFGRGLFQTLYEPPSSLTAFLPLTFEWSAAAIVLALAGLVGGGWWLLLVVPLLATWAMCINGALKGADRPALYRAEGPRAGGVVDLSRPAAARLGAHQMAHPRDAGRAARRTRRDRAARPDLVARARLSSRFLERDRNRERGADRRVDGVPGAAEILSSCPTPGGAAGISRSRAAYAAARWSLVCAENHGGAKRLLRVRCTMRLSRFALFLLRGYALLTAFALMLGWPLAAAAIAAGGARQRRRSWEQSSPASPD